MDTCSFHFPDFKHRVEEISAYLYVHCTFIIALKNGTVIRYTTSEWRAFDAWLKEHNIRNVAVCPG